MSCSGRRSFAHAKGFRVVASDDGPKFYCAPICNLVNRGYVAAWIQGSVFQNSWRTRSKYRNLRRRFRKKAKSGSPPLMISSGAIRISHWASPWRRAARLRRCCGTATDSLLVRLFFFFSKIQSGKQDSGRGQHRPFPDRHDAFHFVDEPLASGEGFATMRSNHLDP